MEQTCFRAGSPIIALARAHIDVVVGGPRTKSGRAGSEAGTTAEAQTCSLGWQSTTCNPWLLLVRRQAWAMILLLHVRLESLGRMED